MKSKFFPTQTDFRKWLEDNHDKESELLVGFYKVNSGKSSMTWPQSVDEALCFGWIDGVRRSIDAESYAIRFTPRKPKSIWSAVNIKKVEELTAKGLMKPAGIAAFERREESKSRIYAYENKPIEFSDEFEKLFRANENAWRFFEKQPNGYRRTSMYWVMSAKQHSTQVKRLEKLIKASASNRRI
ncbi:MAG TPA: YdeI/OmpD-associated family protein [Pyrinomonadaceae bacterium]